MYILVSILIVGFLLLAKFKPVWAFYAAIALAPWQEMMVDLGLRLSLYTVSLIGVVAAVFYSNSKKNEVWKVILNRKWIYMLFFIGWVILDSLVHVNYNSEAVIAGGVLRSPAIRPIVQVISMIVMLIPVICAPVVFRAKSDLVGAAKSYLASITILIVIGWCQLLYIKYFQMDPLPMGLVNGWLGGSGVIRSGIDSGPGNAIIFRMSSFGGEPRYLAQSAAAALLLIQVFYQEQVIKNKTITLFIYLNILAGLLATMAMSGIYLWLLGSLVLALYYLYSQRDGLVISKMKEFSILLAGLITAITCASLLADFEWGYLLSRILRRGLIADFDRVVLDFLMAEPMSMVLGVGLGNIHLYADPYLNPYFRDFAGATSFVADSGWLRLLSELGLVGLILFLVFMINLLSSIGKNLSSTKQCKWAIILKCIFCIGLFGYLARGNTFAPVAFMLIGLSIAPIFWDKMQLEAQSYE